MPYRKKNHWPGICITILFAALAGTGGAIGYDFWEKEKITQEMTQLSEQIRISQLQLEKTSVRHTQFLADTHASLKAEREAEEARIAEQKRKAEEARIAAEKAEAERKRQAELKRQEEERKRQEEEQRRKEAEEAALKAETIAAEKEKAEAEKAERARISGQIKAQEANAQAEMDEYLNLMPTPIVDLRINSILQNPELPNGCEVTALAIVLNSMGYMIDKSTLSDYYLPQFPFYMANVNGEEVRAGGDPSLFYAGSPKSRSNAYYCFAGPVVSAANTFLNERGSAAIATDITGAGEEELINQLDMGNPVIAWGTLSMGDAFTFAPNAWIINEETGEKHIPFLNLHCVVLTGYDEDFFYLADPIRGNVVYKRSTFMNAYNQIGRRAAVIS